MSPSDLGNFGSDSPKKHEASKLDDDMIAKLESFEPFKSARTAGNKTERQSGATTVAPLEPSALGQNYLSVYGTKTLTPAEQSVFAAANKKGEEARKRMEEIMGLTPKHTSSTLSPTPRIPSDHQSTPNHTPSTMFPAPCIPSEHQVYAPLGSYRPLPTPFAKDQYLEQDIEPKKLTADEQQARKDRFNYYTHPNHRFEFGMLPAGALDPDEYDEIDRALDRLQDEMLAANPVDKEQRKKDRKKEARDGFKESKRRMEERMAAEKAAEEKYLED